MTVAAVNFFPHCQQLFAREERRGGLRGPKDTGLPSQDDSDEFFKVKHGVELDCVGSVYERKLE